MKVFAAIAVLAALAAVGVRAYQRAARALEARSARRGAEDSARAREAAQSLVPAHGFEGHCLVTTYGDYVVAFEVEGPNLSLSTPEEKDAQIARLSAALSGESCPYTIYRMLAPVDDTAQVRALNRQLALIDAEEAEISERVAASGRRADFQTEKRLRAIGLRRDHIRRAYLPQYGGEGSSYRSRAYVAMSFPGSPKAREAAMRTAGDFMARLASAGYRTHLLAPDEMVAFLVNCNGRFPSPEEGTGYARPVHASAIA